MKKVLLLIGLFVVNVAVSHPDNTLSTTPKRTTGDFSPLWSLMQKSFQTCLTAPDVDREAAQLVAQHEGATNRKANCLRACILYEADLINDDTKFNSKKFRNLLKADIRYTHEMITMYMALAKICTSLAERKEDRCVVAQIYFLCVDTIVLVREGASFPQH